MKKRNRLIDKIRRAKKAVMGTLTGLSTLVVMLAPQFSEQYKVGVGAVGILFSGLVIYFTTNEE